MDIDMVCLKSEKPNFDSSQDRCVLMFSGGRDSTLAAIRLYESGINPLLVTVTSEHLAGLASVEVRLAELKRILPAEIMHFQLEQPCDLRVNQNFYSRTCLPCQHAYVVVAAWIAKKYDITRIALGYSGYQSDWPEQTPLATASLERVLDRYGLELSLPSYSFVSKDEVKILLSGYGLSTESLEQKCIRQIHNIALSPGLLEQEILGWERAIGTSLEKLSEIKLKVVSNRLLGSY